MLRDSLKDSTKSEDQEIYKHLEVRKNCQWTKEEKAKLIEGILLYGKNWEKIS